MPLAEQLSLALAFVTLGLALRLTILEHLQGRHQSRSRKMKFDAAKVVEELAYDFRPHCDKYGTVREPSDRQLADYMAQSKKLAASLKEKLPEGILDSDSASATEMFDAVENLDPEIVVEFHQDMAGIFATLCSGDPSRDDILRLPIRIRVMFYAWLQQEVMNPEAVPGGGSNVTTLPARAG